MLIRPETAADHATIARINIAAFADHPHSRQTEHLIVAALRNACALTLSLVAEDRGEVVGHIAFSPALIDGEARGWFTLGPLAVLPERQVEGIGARLVRVGIGEICRLGGSGCVLVGPPGYYRRFGFRHDGGLWIEGVPPEYVLCLPLREETPRGAVTHHPAFLADA